MYSLRAEKRGLHPNITSVHGDRGCRNPIPGDVAETRGFALGVPKVKRVQKACHVRHIARIAPTGRIVPTPSDVSDKGASTKRCARKKKMTIIHKHIPAKRMYRQPMYLLFTTDTLATNVSVADPKYIGISNLCTTDIPRKATAYVRAQP